MRINLNYPFLYSYICWNLSRLKHSVPAGVTFNKFAGTQQCFLACVLAEESVEFIFN